jgi:hypothetical protein
MPGNMKAGTPDQCMTKALLHLFLGGSLGFVGGRRQSFSLCVQVNKVNNEILRLGGDKVKMLNKIKDFRKSINLIAWEHMYLGQMARDLEEHHKDLQLTRVTRNLQEMLEVRRFGWFCTVRGSIGRGPLGFGGIGGGGPWGGTTKVCLAVGLVAACVRVREASSRRLPPPLLVKGC